MRRRSAILLCALLAVAGALRLAVAVADAEALRCAIACGHAAAGAKGAACCPIGDGSGGTPAFKTCSRGAGQALVPLLPAQPLLVAVAAPLDIPSESGALDLPAATRPRHAFVSPPEKVPLRLG